MADYSMLIGGKLVKGDETFDVINPAVGKSFAKAPHCTEQHCKDAVAAAKDAFPSWAATPIEQRKEIVQKALGIISENTEKIAEVLCKEQGKPKGGETPERQMVGATFEMLFTQGIIASSLKLNPEPITNMDTPGSKVDVIRKPIGPVVGILPWNFPVAMLFQKAAPALVLGNTFVAKPSPFTPLTTLLCGELLKDCFPPGVLNIITADDNKFRAGAVLTSHPDIRKVSFTGSVPTGKAIMKCCAEDVKRVTLEMGGNDVAIVREDCDVKKTAQGVFKGAFINSGQVCVAIKRAYVHKKIYDEFVKEITEVAKNSKWGDGMEPTTEYGPLNNKMQYDKVLEFISDAKKNGATIETGGKAMERDGFFIEPTIVTGIKEGVMLVDEEQFGPVLPVIQYEEDDDAVKRANNSLYGLGGSVWSSDLNKANELAAKIDAGTVWVNEHLGNTNFSPFGGFKWSGLGREGGFSDIGTWTEMQSLKTSKPDGVDPAPPAMPASQSGTKLSEDYKMCINGELVSTKETFDVINPATGKAFAKAPHCTEDDCNAAVKAAVDAFPSWAATPIAKRKECLQKALGVLMAAKDEISELLCKEQGKPKGGETAERSSVGATFEMMFTAGIISNSLALSPDANNTLDDETASVNVIRKPIGPVVGILPWNFPVAMLWQKAAPALVLGNTFVAKPSPFTPLTSLVCCELIKDCFPPGVLNIITADDNKFRAGAVLTSHPDIRKVSFTGSVPTGKAIMKCCAEHVKRVTLEMGGNDAAIVREDCDVKKAAQGVFKGAFINSGQVCVAIKRAYVHKKIYSEFVKEITEVAKNSKWGDGMEPTTEYGPLNNKMQYDKVLEFISDAKKNGATIETGGKAMERDGFFIEPTIVTGIKEGVMLVDEEQFGPVLPVIQYEEDDDAVKRANNSLYGLGGSVWSSDLNKANELAAKIDAGTVWVNEHLGNTNFSPFGGFKWSGLGREGGFSDIGTWTEMQSLKTAKVC